MNPQPLTLLPPLAAGRLVASHPVDGPLHHPAAQVAALYQLALDQPPADFARPALGWVAASFGLTRLRWWRLDDFIPPRLHEIGAGAPAPVWGDCPPAWRRLAFADLPRHCWDVQPADSPAVDWAGLTLICRLLPEAEHLSHQAWLRLQQQLAAAQGEPGLGTAIVTRDGCVLSADARFRQYLLQLHPAWPGRELPFSLEWHPRLSSHGMTYRGLFLRAEPVGDHYHLRLRPDRRAPDWTEREYLIASGIAKGRTFKELGRELGLAPSTVSTHLYNLYAKIGVRRRAELVEWLARQAPPLQ